MITPRPLPREPGEDAPMSRQHPSPCPPVPAHAGGKELGQRGQLAAQRPGDSVGEGPKWGSGLPSQTGLSSLIAREWPVLSGALLPQSLLWALCGQPSLPPAHDLGPFLCLVSAQLLLVRVLASRDSSVLACPL